MSSGLCRIAESITAMEKWCKGCPIYEYTGLPHCDGTPFDDIVNAKVKVDYTESCQRMLALLGNLYKERFGTEYKPRILKEE